MKIFLTILILILIISQIALVFIVQKQRFQMEELLKMQAEYNTLSSQIMKTQGALTDNQSTKFKSEIDILSTRVQILEQQQMTNKLEAEINAKRQKIESLERELLKK